MLVITTCSLEFWLARYIVSSNRGVESTLRLTRQARPGQAGLTLLPRGVHAMLALQRLFPQPYSFVKIIAVVPGDILAVVVVVVVVVGNISVVGNVWSLSETIASMPRPRRCRSPSFSAPVLCVCLYVCTPPQCPRWRRRGCLFFRCVYNRYIGYIAFCISSVPLRISLTA